MKEDVLEQVVDDYLQFRGYFTRHNIKYRPNPKHPKYDQLMDSNYSDIDVIGFNPRLKGPKAVWAVSCKSTQFGFSATNKIQQIEGKKKIPGPNPSKAFRELLQPKWSAAFHEKIRELTGRTKFTYVTAVTRVKGERSPWSEYSPFVKAMRHNPIRILTLRDIVDDMLPAMGTTLASSEIGRTLQLLKAAKLLEQVSHGG